MQFSESLIRADVPILIACRAVNIHYFNYFQDCGRCHSRQHLPKRQYIFSSRFYADAHHHAFAAAIGIHSRCLIKMVSRHFDFQLVGLGRFGLDESLGNVCSCLVNLLRKMLGANL